MNTVRHAPDAVAGRDWLARALAGNHDPDWRAARQLILDSVNDLDTALDVLAEVLGPYLRARVTRYEAGGQRSPLIATPRAKQKANPPRLVAAALLYKRILAIQERVEDGSWKFLGDMTSAEVRFAAAQREKHAADNLAAAKRYQRLADALDQSKKDRVRDLDGDVVVEVMAR